MITLHRFGRRHEPFLVNPDLVATVDANPDTVLTLTTGTRFVVAESPAEVADAICAWRSGIFAEVPAAAMLAREQPFKSRAPRPITTMSPAAAESARFAGLGAQ
jgi:flagellar protein FlbD